VFGTRKGVRVYAVQTRIEAEGERESVYGSETIFRRPENVLDER